MGLFKIHGVIDRGGLVNFTVDPDIAQRIIPSPFRPKVYKGKAVVGICLIRLKQIRPKGLPGFIGIGSENGAYRIAVEWSENNSIREGVFIPRRDTSSLFNTIAGGRIFPGRHFHAKFDVKEQKGNYHIAFRSSDGTTISIDGEKNERLNPDSIFSNLEEASAFFEKGAVGYSPNGNKLEGPKLRAYNWKIVPLSVSRVESSFFANESLLPKGSVKFDNALLMTEIKHNWESVENKNLCL